MGLDLPFQKKLSHAITLDSLWRKHIRGKKRGNCWFWGVLYQSELDADPSLHVLFWASFFAYCILQLFLHRFLYHRIFMTHVVVWESRNLEVACVCFGLFVEFWEKNEYFTPLQTTSNPLPKQFLNAFLSTRWFLQQLPQVHDSSRSIYTFERNFLNSGSLCIH